MKLSKFRVCLFNVSREYFDKFFNKEEIEKIGNDTEKQLVFKTKLYGNLDFIGELYRRKMLSDAVLISVISSLLGTTDLNMEINDQNIEGATKLMNKVGESFQERMYKKKAKNDGSKDPKATFDDIMKTFDDYMNLPDEDTRITKRLKLIIKNMFTNKESGWEKTKETNSGPKTKLEVQNELILKYEKERERQDNDRNN